MRLTIKQREGGRTSLAFSSEFSSLAMMELRIRLLSELKDYSLYCCEKKEFQFLFWLGALGRYGKGPNRNSGQKLGECIVIHMTVRL